jgi:acid phosphatase type 7
VVRTAQRIYAPNEPITVSFFNGPGAPKDWIGFYPRNREPGPGSTLWVYTDGTTSGTESVFSGTVEFTGGLGVGEWAVYLLANDGYDAIAGETIFVESTAVDLPRLSVSLAGDTVTISWSNGAGFVLLTSASLSSPDWQPVEGVSNSSLTLASSEAEAYFQLRKE